MLSHVTLGTTDVARAVTFYAPIMDVLGWALKFSDDTWAGWTPAGADRPLFIVTRPFDGSPAHPGNGTTVALLAGDRALVSRCHALALQGGGRDEGRPGLRPQYHPNYFGAYLRDLDDNKLCICCHAAP